MANNLSHSGAQNETALARTSQGVSGLAVSGLVLGILAVFGSWIPLLNFFTIPFSITGIILSVSGYVVVRKGEKGGFGITVAGIVVNLAALLLFYASYAVLF